MIYVEVSEHGGYPQIIHFFKHDFPWNKPSILGYPGVPPFQETPIYWPSCHLTVIPRAGWGPVSQFMDQSTWQFYFFLLLILGINIIRNMQGFWIAKLDFPDVFCMERSSHPLSNPWHHTPKWSKMNNLIQPLKQGVWRGVRYWRHGVQTECLRIWWGIITLW